MSRTPQIIETPCGRMTRAHASILSGVPYRTLCRRIWQRFPIESLFMPSLCGTEFEGRYERCASPAKLTMGRGAKKGRAVTYNEKSLTMSWHEWREEKRRSKAKTSA